MRRAWFFWLGLWSALTLVGGVGCTKPRAVLALRVTSDVRWGDGALLQSLAVTVRRGGMDGPLRCGEGDAFGCPMVLRLGTGDGQRQLPLTFVLTPAEASDRTSAWVEVLGCGAATGCSSRDAVVSWSRVLAYTSEATVPVEVFLTQGTDAGTGLDADASETGMPDVVPDGPCVSPRMECGSRCVDTNSDAANCGSCGRACRTDQACSGGACGCPSGQTECGGRCVDPTREPQHCGRCGNVCASGRCTSGVCDCPTGQTRCGTACVDTQTDAMNCGMCGRACRARGACIAGVCIEQRSCRTPGTPGCGVVDIAGGGPFTLGGDSMANDASTAQPGVSVGRFALDRYEVTVARFRRYWEAGHPGVTGGVLYPGETAAGVTVPWSGPMSVTGPSVRDTSTASPNFCNWTVSASDREGHPINCVDWYTAQAFCVWDGGLLSTNGQTGRLPTEAEWEFAARGTEGRPWPWGTTMIASQACWDRCRNYPTDCLGTCLEEDASFAAGATPSGVRHMVGNVWEWTADNYGSYSAMTSSDPCINRSGRQNPVCNSSATGNRVVRGGSWLNIDVADLRSASRLYGTPVGRYYYLGFRCAGTVTE